METKQIRQLTADDIDLRVGQVFKDGGKDIAVSLLPYKNARVDMAIMDETYGTMNWQRRHEFKDGRLYCTVSVYDPEKQQWIDKEDVGTESNTEAEKGQASDSFKRACVNWGIGRELYTVPFIYVPLKDGETVKNAKFFVKEIGYVGNEIASLIIVDKNNNQRYRFNKSQPAPQQKPQTDTKRKEVTDFLTNLPDDKCQQWINYFHIDDIDKMPDAKVVEVWNYMHSQKK